MKRLVFLLGLCVCMVYGDEYSKQKAEFMSKNFESKLKELVKESGGIHFISVFLCLLAL